MILGNNVTDTLLKTSAKTKSTKYTQIFDYRVEICSSSPIYFMTCDLGKVTSCGNLQNLQALTVLRSGPPGVRSFVNASLLLETKEPSKAYNMSIKVQLRHEESEHEHKRDIIVL